MTSEMALVALSLKKYMSAQKCVLCIPGLTSLVYLLISAFCHGAKVCRGDYPEEAGVAGIDDYLDKSKGNFIYYWMVILLWILALLCCCACTLGVLAASKQREN